MKRSIVDLCKTVTVGARSAIFYKSVFLALTEYKEQPNELDGLEVVFELAAEEDIEPGTIDIIVRTPLMEMGDRYDLSYPFSFSAEEFKRFEKVQFDPLMRGFYPTQSKIDDGYFIDITNEFSIGNGLRCYLDSNLMASILDKMTTSGNDLPLKSDFIYDIKKKLIDTLAALTNSKTSIEREGYAIIEYKSHHIRFSYYEDEFGPLVALDSEYLPFDSNIELKLIEDKKTNTYYITINDIVFDKFTKADHIPMLNSTYESVSVNYGTISRLLKSNLRDIISTALNIDRGTTYSRDLSDLINQSKINRGYELPDDTEIIKEEYVQTNDISGIQFIDYDEYIVPLKITSMLM